MRLRAVLLCILLAGLGAWGLRAQKPFQRYDTIEGHAEIDLPPDWNKPSEWTRARLMYHNYRGGCDRFSREGSWTIDYPKSDQHLLQGIRRLTRIDTRSVEQSVALDDSD